MSVFTTVTADDLRRWEERRQAIYQHYRESKSMRKTGKAFGISPERVRQIVNRMETTDGQDHARGSNQAPPVGAGER